MKFFVPTVLAVLATALPVVNGLPTTKQAGAAAPEEVSATLSERGPSPVVAAAPADVSWPPTWPPECWVACWPADSTCPPFKRHLREVTPGCWTCCSS